MSVASKSVAIPYSESVMDLYSENGRHRENMLYPKSKIFTLSEGY